MSAAIEVTADLSRVQHLLETWSISKGANTYTLVRVRQLWNPEFLLQLGIPKRKGLYWPSRPANKNYRFLFRHHLCVTLLGIRERLVEGAPGSIPPAVDNWLRFKHWPDAKGGNRSHGGNSFASVHARTDKPRSIVADRGLLQRVVEHRGIQQLREPILSPEVAR